MSYQVKLVCFMAWAILSGVVGASANTISVFEISGTVGTASLSGTISIDVTAGSITAESITVQGFAIFNQLGSQGSFGPTAYLFDAFNNSSDLLRVNFPANGGSLVNYMGGSLNFGGGVFACPNSQCDFTNPLEAGSTGSLTATPLPAALPLFATGLGGLGLLGWRRKRKAPAVPHPSSRAENEGAMKALSFIAAALAAMVLGSSGARAATLSGDSISAEYDFGSLGTSFTCGGANPMPCFSPSSFTVGAGIETTGTSDIFSPTFDFSGNQLTITFPSLASFSSNAITFNGPVFTIT